MPKENLEVMMTNVWTTVLEQDPDDPEGLILTLPDDLLAQAGWHPGDVLVWEIQDENTVILRKK